MTAPAATGQTRSLKASWARLQPFIGASRGRMALLVFASLVSGFTEAAILVIVARVALAISDSREQASVTLGVLGTQVVITVPALLAIAGVLTLIRLAAEWTNAYLPARLSADVQGRLRKQSFGSYLHSSWGVQSNEREGHLQELLTNQILLASQSVLFFAQGTTAVLNLGALLLAALVINPFAALTIMATGVVLFVALRPMTLKTKRHATHQAAANIAYANSISETTSMSQEIRVFGADANIQTEVDDKVDATTDSYFRQFYLGGLVPAVYRSVALGMILVALAALYAIGGNQIVSLSAILLILLRVLGHSQNLQVIYQKIVGLSPYMDRVRERTAAFDDAAVSDGGRPLPRVDEIAFREAGFSYVKGQAVLSDVSMAAPRGSSIGIVGPSGAGKSTFVQLLLRLRDPDTGLFLINGDDARGFSLADWYQRIAFVPQDSRVLSTTVAENIRFFRDGIDQSMIEAAARRAHIHDEILSWPLGYDTPIGQRAEAVSGGQRQRICLARALAHDPDIIVLDEPTSALDVKSESEVQRSLAELKGEVSLFIVAHRLSTLSICDQVMVFRDGRLEAFDSAENLTMSNDFFGEAVELSQLS